MGKKIKIKLNEDHPEPQNSKKLIKEVKELL
jgi:phenylpyruvate tautomerase PptA (4-oxalocrotonate tautomerase family)